MMSSLVVGYTWAYTCISYVSVVVFQDMISIILAITFLVFSYNEMMPRVSYIKAMDVYLGVSQCLSIYSSFFFLSPRNLHSTTPISLLLFKLDTINLF